MLELTVHAAAADADQVRVLDLRRADGGPLPPFEAGAHIALTLPGDRVRQYSLLNDPAERDRYVIAVAREAAGRGGSAWLHDRLAEGDRLAVSAPLNHFRLVEDAPHSVLIAAGIGVTPLWSMVQRLAALGRPWELHYGARNRSAAALLDRIEAAGGPVSLCFSREPGGGRLDIPAIVDSAPPGAHFYCCGPAGVLEAFQAATGALAGRAHLEHFARTEAAAVDGGFTVVLARSRREIAVQPGQTILGALKAAGVRASYSCSEGVCGQCETRVLEGRPDHRDAVLTEAERETGQTMMICCSGAKTDRLVLDL